MLCRNSRGLKADAATAARQRVNSIKVPVLRSADGPREPRSGKGPRSEGMANPFKAQRAHLAVD